MFTCCGSRAKNTTEIPSPATPSPHKITTTTPDPPLEEPPQLSSSHKTNTLTDVTNTTNLNTQEQEEGQQQQQQQQIDPPTEPFDLNSSIFMPDPSKRRPSAFELASASYAEATDFNTKDQLPAMNELEAVEEDSEAILRGREGDEMVGR